MIIRKYADKRYIHIILILILGVLAYSNSFQGSFLFDDLLNIVENPLIKSPDLIIDSSIYCSKNIMTPEQESLCKSFKTRLIGYYSFALNYKMHRLDVFGYHIVNLFIHILNSILVYYLLILLFKTPLLVKFAVNNSRLAMFIALFSALLFALHPVQTQAVTYIVQRFTSLATLFYLFAIVMYIAWRLIVTNKRLQSIIFYLASIASVILAMKTKEIAFTLPIIVIICEIMFFEKKIKHSVIYLMPFLLTLCIIPFSHIDIHKSSLNVFSSLDESTKVMTSMSRWDYLLTQFRVIVTYLRLIISPVNQNVDYDYTIYRSFFDFEVLLSFMLLVSIISCAIYLLFYSSKQKKQELRLISFGILWFFITLSIESSIIPIADVIFEHRVYLPSVGLFIVISTSIFVLTNKLQSKFPNVLRATVILFMIIIIILAGTSYARNAVWKDEISLWSDVVKKSPKKARGYNNLGFAYEKAGLYAKALEKYNKAININAKFDDAYYNRANTYAKLGQYDNSIIAYTNVIMLNQRYANAYNNRGVVYSLVGEIDKAIEDFSQAIYINPMLSEAFYNRALSYQDKGLLDIPDFQQACNLGHSNSCETLKRLM
jgi:tetratricopeptide (TPR) repeat protein